MRNFPISVSDLIMNHPLSLLYLYVQAGVEEPLIGSCITLTPGQSPLYRRIVPYLCQSNRLLYHARLFHRHSAQ